MPEIATKLTSEEMTALAAWFSTQAPLPKD